MAYIPYSNDCDVSTMLGKTLTSISISQDDDVTFVTEGGEQFQMWHRRDCCESVSLEDVVGELSDLIGSPLLVAEEVSSEGTPPLEDSDSSYTWTFYKFATIKGSVTLRWFGSSNGWYSEGVDFARITPEVQ